MVDIKISELTEIDQNQLTDLFEISRNLGGGVFESRSEDYSALLYSVSGAHVITVGADGGARASSIEAALTLASLPPIGPPSAINPVVIQVRPGVYTENNPLTVPSYVSIISTGDSNTTYVKASTATAPVFIMESYSTVAGIYIQNASGVGGAAAKGTGTNCIVENCGALNCETGFWANGAACLSMRCVNCAVVKVPGYSCTYGYRADDGALLTISNSIVNGATAFSLIPKGFYVEGSGSKINISTFFSLYCVDGIYSDNGGVIDSDGGFIQNCTNAIRIGAVGSDSKIISLATSIENSTTYDVIIESITGHIDFSGSMNYNKRSIVSGAGFHSIGIDDENELLKMTGESTIEESVNIGVPGASTDALGVGFDVGEGGSYTTDRYGVEIVEYWAYDASAVSGSRFTRYTDNAGTQLIDENDAIVVGSKYPFSAPRVDINVAANVGSNSIVVEHWNGATWTGDTVCAYRKTDMLHRGNTIFQNVETQYIEVGTAINDDWVSDDNVLDNIPNWDYGSDMYALRFRNNGGSLTTAMEFDSGKVRGDDFDVTDAQETVNWGRYRGTETTIRLISDTVPSSTNPPSDEIVTVSPNIDGVWKAKFTDGNVCSSSFKQIIPDWADTSSGITLTINMYPSDGTAGDVDITLRYVPIVDGFVFDGSATEYSADLITAASGVTKELFSVDYTFNISSFSPGDEFIVAIERDATAGNANDTYAGDIVVTGFKMTWTRKIVG